MKKPLEFLLAFVAALPSIFAVLFTPSLPILAEHFQVTFGETQQTMVFYLAGYALGQLPYGPLSNKFGRKPVFYLGMLLAILSSIGVIISGMVHSFPLFIISRFCMACGACVGLNVAYTIVGDLYDENKALKVLSFIMLLSAIIPGLATFTGGFLTQNFGWQGCFVFLGIFGLLMIALVYKFLPETTRQKDPNAIQIHQIFKAYWSEIHNKKLIFSSLITGCGASMIYLFASTAPFIGINFLKLTPEKYGSFAAIPALGLLCGSLLTRLWTLTMSLKALMLIGSFALIGISLCFSALFYFSLINIYTLFSPMLLIDTALAMIFTTTATIALTQARNKSIGSSLMSFINLSLTTCSVIILSLIPVTAPVILPILFLCLGLVIFCLVLQMGKHMKASM